MLPAIKVLMNMGSLHRLLPFFLLGLVISIVRFDAGILIAVAYGIILQFFVEYALHRFLLHRKPPTEQSPFNALYRSHIAHHEFPNDPEFFTGDDHWYPVRFGLKAIAIHSIILWPFVGLLSGITYSCVALFVGSVLAFTFYEYCHTIAHLNVPKGRIGQTITRSHLLHHYQDHHATFHVSLGMGWIDKLFGTAHDKEEAKKRFDRDTLLSLGMDPYDLRLITARKAFGITKTPMRGKS